MTTAVPSARGSGRVRCGFFTSPAAKVMSCQESAERIQEECSGISVQYWPMGRRDPGLILKQSTAEARVFSSRVQVLKRSDQDRSATSSRAHLGRQ